VTLLLRYVRTGSLELLRYPAFSVPTLLFPTLLFLLLAARTANEEAPRTMAGFAAVALIGVAFFQFGVGIAAERASPWESFLRSLPVSPSTRIGSRVGSALLYGGASTALVITAALVTTPVSLPTIRWFAFAVVLLLGSVPFALFGIALGYWIRPRAALPVANLLFLPLVFAGGLFTGQRDVSGDLGQVTRFLPTGQWRELLWGAVDGRFPSVEPAIGLCAYTVAFAVLAVLAYRRDEGERYG
jgi:ABC-2 type transport system permease protein